MNVNSPLDNNDDLIIELYKMYESGFEVEVVELNFDSSRKFLDGFVKVEIVITGFMPQLHKA